MKEILKRLSASRFVRFAVVGGAGYFVDLAILLLMVKAIGIDPYSGRLASFMGAVTFTWWGNRTLTFAEHSATGACAIAMEWLKFFGANSVGAVVNLGLYTALITFAAYPFSNIFVAQPIGIIAGLVFNFTLSKKFVFRIE
ncbi:MAG: GtrA family protein [Alphaproteobacteria bacterium]|nr:GtrA family protein [Alphaproteobacteria bacterium]MDE2629905.1 GtrA family protein [Alphaproteobacteria bacterium]